MHVLVLGPIEVCDRRNELVGIGGPVPTRLLALLAASGSDGISVDKLVDELWAGMSAPADPEATLRTNIARLRSAIGPKAIITGRGRYLIAGEVTTDAQQFGLLVERARRASGSPNNPELWREALDLWRGEAYAGYEDLESIRPVATGLHDLRAEATEAWIDARLGAGEAREVVPDVEAALRVDPLREGLRAQHLTALARAGRRVDALRAFEGFRAELTEVGLEPSPRLVELDREIVNGTVPTTGARRTLRGYDVSDLVGEGAFAVVYRAMQTSVGREVAIKQIRSVWRTNPTSFDNSRPRRTSLRGLNIRISFHSTTTGVSPVLRTW